MWEKMKQKGKRLTIWVAAMAMAFGMYANCDLSVYAAESNFVIEAEMLPSNEETYDIQLNVENLGADWEGTVRVIVDENYHCPSAYDTTISLPQGSEKQFVVRVPVDSMEDTNGTIWVSLWDKKNKKVADKEIKRLLLEEADCLTLGILSDEYSSLTYMDMGGESFYFYGDEYPIRLEELHQGSLVDRLEAMDFLVIDTYNTEILTDEEIQALDTWVYDGGVLLVGTGSHAEDTLAGLGDSILNVNLVEVHEAGQTSTHYYSDYVDLSQIALAELEENIVGYSSYVLQYCSSAMACSYGDGAMGILPYALTDVPDMSEEFYNGMDQEYFVMNMLEETSSYSSLRYNYTSSYYDGGNRMSQYMLRCIGNNNSPLHFNGLKAIIILYVIFVGPILYLILMFMKKRELYWVTVPVSALVGIILIYFAGRGFEVADTRVYSVATEELSGKKDGRTYLYCYDAKHEEWELKLQSGYDYVGALMNDEYYYSDEKEDIYYHHMKKEGDTLSFGINPSSNFENSYFYAGKSGSENVSSGNIVTDNVICDWSGISGTVTNETAYSFPYFAVVANDELYVYEGLAAGESKDLAQEIPLYEPYQGYNVWNEYVHEFLYDLYTFDKEEPENISALSALGVGVCAAYPEVDPDRVVVVGLTENWDAAVDDFASEISYGCLYTVR